MWYDSFFCYLNSLLVVDLLHAYFFLYSLRAGWVGGVGVHEVTLRLFDSLNL